MFRLAQAAVAEAEPQPRGASPILLALRQDLGSPQDTVLWVARLPQPADGQGQPPAGGSRSWALQNVT